MICLRCDNENFMTAPDAVIEQNFKGKTFQVQSPALKCSKCGWITLDANQVDELCKRTADAYRKACDKRT
jgi:aspartate carbamoyltransferase regulatory subunit